MSRSLSFRPFLPLLLHFVANRSYKVTTPAWPQSISIRTEEDSGTLFRQRLVHSSSRRSIDMNIE